MIRINIGGSRGETYAMVLSETIRSASYEADESARTALKKIQQASRKGKISVSLNQEEASQIFNSLGEYIEDFSWSPTEESFSSPRAVQSVISKRQRTRYPDSAYTEED